MKKVKKFIIYVLFILIILASFKAPEILFKLQNELAETEVHKIKEEKCKIDIETQKIYLVKAIHDMEQEKMDYTIMYDNTQDKYRIIESISNDEEAKKEICKEIIKLQDSGVISNLNINAETLIRKENLDRKYTNKENKYTINCHYMEVDNDYFGYEIESKTEKIIYIVLDEKFIPEIEKEEILKNYIKYLELAIIDDWEYKNKMLISEKAGLVARLIEEKGTNTLSINTEAKIKRVYYNDAISIYDNDQR